ncbi:pseudoazurin [Leisingera caerulea]|uniref:pseudoazurin n=1 Tax=Leisingera caerulea TaxID=506591 RepID=UPI0021A27258|nr:pseudoazurin [Leisingera caerulea]UWQ86011.1 pseudoazurin [Leisingera caerulea]
MKLKSLTAATLLALAPVSVLAETIEVKMLNRGEAGAMVFEPRFVSAQVGDIVVFRATDKGHNAETVKGMVPEGQEPFAGKINEEIEVELTTEGMIGVKCKPHLGMGMVMVIQVGDSDMPDGFLDAKMPKKAKTAFEEIVAEGAN